MYEFKVTLGAFTMKCLVFRRGRNKPLMLTGTIDGVCRIEQDVDEQFRTLNEKTFCEQLQKLAAERLKSIAEQEAMLCISRSN